MNETGNLVGIVGIVGSFVLVTEYCGGWEVAGIISLLIYRLLPELYSVSIIN